jgi:hypothetical protein
MFLSSNKAIADYLGQNGFYTALEEFKKEAEMVSTVFLPVHICTNHVQEFIAKQVL